MGPIPIAPMIFQGQPCFGTVAVAGSTQETFRRHTNLGHRGQVLTSQSVEVPGSTFYSSNPATESMETRSVATGASNTCQGVPRVVPGPPAQPLQNAITVPFVPFVRHPAPIADFHQPGNEPIAVSFGTFQYTAAHPVTEAQRSRETSTVPHSGGVETLAGMPRALSALPADENVLDELKGTVYYHAILDLLETVGLHGESRCHDEVPQVEEEINGSGGAAQESRGRTTHFGINRRGPAWKYSSHCGEARRKFRQCKFCGRKIPVKYHHRFVMNLLGLLKRSPCSIPDMEKEQLLEMSDFARKAFFNNANECQDAEAEAVSTSQTVADLPVGKRRRISTGSLTIKPFILIDEGLSKLMRSIMKLVILRVRPFALFDKLKGQFNSAEREMLALLHPGIEGHLPTAKAVGGSI